MVWVAQNISESSLISTKLACIFYGNAITRASVTLAGQQTNKLQKLIALEQLSAACEDGFSANDIELMLEKATTIKGRVECICRSR